LLEEAASRLTGCNLDQQMPGVTPDLSSTSDRYSLCSARNGGPTGSRPPRIACRDCAVVSQYIAEEHELAPLVIMTGASST